MEMATITTAFNNHVAEFFEDVLRVTPGDKDIIAADVAVKTARRANASLFRRSWVRYTEPYLDQINSKDTGFFLTKDYSTDVANGGAESQGALIDAIERVRIRIGTMTEDQKDKIMGYIYNLTTLARMERT